MPQKLENLLKVYREELEKVTDDKNATDAQKTYEYVEAETKKETTGTKISVRTRMWMS